MKAVNYKSKIKYNLKFIKGKKFKFVLLVLLISITLLSALFYNFLSNYKEQILKEQIKLLVDNNEEFISIIKSQTYFSGEMSDNYKLLTNEEINAINKKLKKYNLDGYEAYKIINKYADTDSIFISQEHNLFDYLGLKNYIKLSSPYNIWDGGFSIVKIDSENKFFKRYNIIGTIPKKNNEIVISNYIANLIIKTGIKDYNGNDYFPKTYDDIVKYDGYLRFGEYNKVKIVGIINYDLSKFDTIKEISWEEFQNNYNLYSETYENLVSKVSNIYKKVFVSNDFLENVKIKPIIEPWNSSLGKTEIIVPTFNETDYINLFSEFRNDEPIIIQNSYSDDANFSNELIDYIPKIDVINKIMIYVVGILFILSSCSVYAFSKFDKEKNNQKYNILLSYTNILIVCIISFLVTLLIYMIITLLFRKLLAPDNIIFNTIMKMNIRDIILIFKNSIIILFCSSILFLCYTIRTKFIVKKNNIK